MNQFSFKQFMVLHSIGYAIIIFIFSNFLIGPGYSLASLSTLFFFLAVWIGALLLCRHFNEKETQKEVYRAKETGYVDWYVSTYTFQVFSALVPITGWMERKNPPQFLVDAWEWNEHNTLHTLLAKVKMSDARDLPATLTLFEKFFKVQLRDTVIAPAILQMVNRLCGEIQELQNKVAQKKEERAALDYFRTLSDVEDVLSPHNTHWEPLQRISSANLQILHSLLEQEAQMEPGTFFWVAFLAEVTAHYSGRVIDQTQVFDIVHDVTKKLVLEGKFTKV